MEEDDFLRCIFNDLSTPIEDTSTIVFIAFCDTNISCNRGR